MKTARVVLILLLIPVFISCERFGRGTKIRIGMDPLFYPMNFMEKGGYINGFVDEVFLEIAKAAGTEFEIILENWSSLNRKLWEDKYDAIVSLMPVLDHTLQHYDFSQEILLVGPILVVPVESKDSQLGKMQGKKIGYITGEDSMPVLEKYPDIFVQNYDFLPEMFDAIVKGEIDGALAEVIIASSYVSDIYKGKLKIAGDPLTDEGLRLVTIKRENKRLISFFNEYLSRLKRSDKYCTLLRKWSLVP